MHGMCDRQLLRRWVRVAARLRRVAHVPSRPRSEDCWQCHGQPRVRSMPGVECQRLRYMVGHRQRRCMCTVDPVHQWRVGVRCTNTILGSCVPHAPCRMPRRPVHVEGPDKLERSPVQCSHHVQRCSVGAKGGYRLVGPRMRRPHDVHKCRVGDGGGINAWRPSVRHTYNLWGCRMGDQGGRHAPRPHLRRAHDVRIDAVGNKGSGDAPRS